MRQTEKKEGVKIVVALIYLSNFCDKNTVIYFDSFGVEHDPEEIKEFIRNKNINANIFRVQANDSATCGYF